ncbi:hypothetical protein [Rhodoferax ferrireducens]|uniref:hypothetical protein n=1 Tax=Rhodoferax ferrireducens TaxID=192843 RepID=UPI000E0D5D16|nr:hypothetical protein [Rhodoferax ferrireducens]
MKLVVTGLSPREETAFGIFLSRTLRNWLWQSVPASRTAVLPPADLIVADLVPLGLGQWSEAAEADLLQRLQGTPAVLLVPAHDQTWAAMDADTVKQHSLVWLAKPYGTKEMQAALEQAALSVKRPARPAAPPPVSASVPAAAPVSARAAPTFLSANPPAVPPAARTPQRVNPVSIPIEAQGLSAAELHARLAALPEPGGQVFLRKLAEMLVLDHPFEARFTVQNSLIVHPADGWIATNTPMTVIERVCQSDALASAVSIRAIDGPQAEERAQRLGMPPSELDVFLSQLVAKTLDRPASRPAPAPSF